MTESFNVKVADFGLARVASETQTMTAKVGTPIWSAPEVSHFASIGFVQLASQVFRC